MGPHIGPGRSFARHRDPNQATRVRCDRRADAPAQGRTPCAAQNGEGDARAGRSTGKRRVVCAAVIRPSPCRRACAMAGPGRNARCQRTAAICGAVRFGKGARQAVFGPWGRVRAVSGPLGQPERSLRRSTATYGGGMRPAPLLSACNEPEARRLGPSAGTANLAATRGREATRALGWQW